MRIVDKILEHSISSPNDIALIYNDIYINYQELADRVQTNAMYLKNIGLGNKEPVGLVAHNSIDFIEWLLAIFILENSVVLLPPYFNSDEFNYHIDKIGLRFAIVQKDFIKYFENCKIKMNFGNCVFLEKASDKLINQVIREDDMIIQFTSGSEGESKAVVRTEKSILNELIFLKDGFQTVDCEIFVPNSPMCHSFGLIGGTLYPLLNGYTILITNPLYIRDTLFQMASNKATYIFAAPYFYGQWAQILKKETLNLSSLKRCYTAGSAASQNIVESFYRYSGVEIYQDYGSTEMGTMALGTEPLRMTLELGHFIGNAKLKVCPLSNLYTGNCLGELAVQNDIMDFQYLYPPEFNLRKFKDGYYLTGDIVEKNANMQLFYKYRNDGCINIAGLKVYPSEIEQLIIDIKGVEDVAVKSVKVDTEEFLIAYVVLKEGQHLTEQEIRAYCKRHIADYKIPKKVIIVDRLEKNSSGKILKKYLPDL